MEEIIACVIVLVLIFIFIKCVIAVFKYVLKKICLFGKKIQTFKLNYQSTFQTKASKKINSLSTTINSNVSDINKNTNSNKKIKDSQNLVNNHPKSITSKNKNKKKTKSKSTKYKKINSRNIDLG